MTTYSADYSPLIDSHVHIDVTQVSHNNNRVKFVYFAFVKYPESTQLVSLFGGDNNYITVPTWHASYAKYVLSVALDAITMRHGDTDSDWFDSYDQDELTWCDSWLCEALQGEYDRQ